jgi:hypothetical protein
MATALAGLKVISDHEGGACMSTLTEFSERQTQAKGARQMRLRTTWIKVVPLALVVAVVAVGAAATPSIATSSPAETHLSFQLQPIGQEQAAIIGSGRTTTTCPRFIQFVLVIADQRAGAGSACFEFLADRTAGTLSVTAYRMTLTLGLAGGTISAVAGTSFIVTSPFQEPQFAGPDYCWEVVSVPGYSRGDCAGAITSAAGVYAGKAGWFTYRWEHYFSEWWLPATITIDFS